MYFQRAKGNGCEFWQVFVLETEAQVPRIEIDCPLHVAYEVANAMKLRSPLSDGGFGGGALGSHISHDVLA